MKIMRLYSTAGFRFGAHAHRPPKWLRAGATVEIEGISTLRNPVLDEAAPSEQRRFGNTRIAA
jgi:hypothetical protein